MAVSVTTTYQFSSGTHNHVYNSKVKYLDDNISPFGALLNQMNAVYINFFTLQGAASYLPFLYEYIHIKKEVSLPHPVL
jgi:hypothetical protein